MSTETPENNNDMPEDFDANPEAEARAAEQAAMDEQSQTHAEDDIHAGYDASADDSDTPDFRAVIEALQAELEQNKEQMMRALAEAENTRQRAKKEREDASKFAIAGFAKDLLDVADNLRRALDAVPADLIEGDERVKNLMGGIEGTERQLLSSFEKNGIKKIEPLDEMFNPNFHEVMFEGPAPEKSAGTIIQVLEPGYVLNERLLRPARVGVAKDEGQGSQIDTEA